MLKKKWLAIAEENEMQLVVLSNSMKPNIVRGDKVTIRGVVDEQISVDDIIVFLHSDKNATVHRVIDISYEDSKMLIRTKGDANEYIDPYEISIDDVIGVVKDVTKKENIRVHK